MPWPQPAYLHRDPCGQPSVFLICLLTAFCALFLSFGVLFAVLGVFVGSIFVDSIFVGSIFVGLIFVASIFVNVPDELP